MRELWQKIRHPWIWVFVIMASFQIFRGSNTDAIIFWSFTALLVLSQFNLPRQIFIAQPKLSNNHKLSLVFALTAALVGIPRHTPLYGFVMLAIGVTAVVLNWQPDSGAKERATPRVSSAKLTWAVFGVGLCLWELAANVLGQLNNTLSEYPTISVLVDPVLDSTIGQAAFVLLWLLSGMGFLRLWSRK